jgi:malonyl-CoA O-methyltransferase
MHDIKNIGASNAVHGRDRGLMGKQRLADFEAAYQQFKQADNRYPVTWEVVYGHAWTPKSLKIEGYDTVIPLYKVHP